MRRRGGHGQWTAGDLLLASLAAAALLALALAGAQRSRLLTLERRASADEAVVGELAAGLTLDLDRGLSAVATAARDATAPQPVDPATAEVPGAAPVSFLPAGEARPGGSSALPASVDERVVGALLDRATDSGEVVLSAPVDYGDEHRTLLVAAAYERDPVRGRPVLTADRRARLAGWVVAPVDLGALLLARLPDGVVASVRDGDVVLPVSTELPDAQLPEQLVDLGGRHLTVRAGDPGGVGIAAPTAGFLVAGPILALGAFAAVGVAAARLRQARAEAAQRAEQVQLIGEVAPLVQQSLELADVLPAVAVQLSDHFGLAGVAVATGTGSTGAVQLFSVGEPPDPATPAVLHPPAALAAGETLSLALQRGGRSVAALQIVAGRDLDAADLQSLRAITELVTAAVVNASLYASQQEALRRLRELDALKTVFLGTASHELRTPATAISGFASLLTASWDRFDDAQRKDFASRIAANARSLSGVVQDLLDFSLLDRGTVAVAVEPLDLGGVVASTVERLAPMFSDHEIEFAAEPAPEVAADVNGVERIVTNLLTNAVKFSPPGTTVSVTVGPSPGGAGAQVVVSDQGPGIPPEERQQVFARFYRGGGDAVVQTRGVGIGLSVVAELVARLHGEVVLDEAPGGGARFTIRLPASSSLLVAKEAEHAPTT